MCIKLFTISKEYDIMITEVRKMQFTIKNFYNFIEINRMVQDLRINELSKLAMPNSPATHYGTSKNELIGSTFVFHSTLVALGYRVMVLKSFTMDGPKTKYIDLDVPLQHFIIQLRNHAVELYNRLPMGLKLETVKSARLSMLQDKKAPNFSTFCKVFTRLNVTWNAYKEVPVDEPIIQNAERA